MFASSFFSEYRDHLVGMGFALIAVFGMEIGGVFGRILTVLGFILLALHIQGIIMLEVAEYIEKRVEAKLDERFAQWENGTFRNITCESIQIKECDTKRVMIYPSSVFLYDGAEHIPSAGFGANGGIFGNVYCHIMSIADIPNNAETIRLQLTPKGIFGYDDAFLKKLGSSDYCPQLENIRLDEHHLGKWITSQLESDDSELRQWLTRYFSTELKSHENGLLNLVVENFQPNPAKPIYDFVNYKPLTRGK